MPTFSLAGHPFITLNNLLKLLRFVGTVGEANLRIEAGEVRVNGETELRKRRKLYAGDRVEIDGQSIAITTDGNV